MKGKILKIIYVVLLILMVFLTIKGFIQGGGASEEIAGKIIEVEDAKVIKENEGKLVLISGKMETDEELEFTDEGVKVKTPILKRKVEMYMYDNDKEKAGKVTKIWSNKVPLPTLIDEDYNKKYYNPTKEILDKEIYSEVLVGDFKVNSEAIKAIQTNAVLSDFIEVPGFRVEDETTLTTAKEGSFQVGDYKMQYHYLDLSQTPEYTFVGKQKDGNLEKYKLETGKNILQHFEGKLTKEEVIEELGSMSKMGNIASITITLLMLVGAVFIFKPKKQEK